MHKESIRDLIEAERMHDRANYVANPDGYYENAILEFSNEDTDNLLSKAIGRRLAELPTVYNLTYKIAFMIRSEGEIRLSMFMAWPDAIIELVSLDELKGIIEARPDFDVTYLHYRDVVLNPVRAFTKLAEAGWPIDVETAASVPDEKHYRNRL